MELKNLEETIAYLEEKFTSTLYTAKATPLTEFGPVMKVQIDFAEDPKCSGPVWVAPTGYTAAVPFKARS